MSPTCNERTETFLTARGYGRFEVRPLWYRSYRLMRIRVPTPASMNLQELFFYNGIWSAVFISVVFGMAVELGHLGRFPMGILIAFPLLMPIVNWIGYRKARQDILDHLKQNPPPAAD